MRHFIEINDDTKEGKTFLSLAVILSKQGKGIDFLKHEIIEEIKDMYLLKKMETSKKTGLANTEKVLEKLGL